MGDIIVKIIGIIIIGIAVCVIYCYPFPCLAIIFEYFVYCATNARTAKLFIILKEFWLSLGIFVLIIETLPGCGAIFLGEIKHISKRISKQIFHVIFMCFLTILFFVIIVKFNAFMVRHDNNLICVILGLAGMFLPGLCSGIMLILISCSMREYLFEKPYEEDQKRIKENQEIILRKSEQQKELKRKENFQKFWNITVDEYGMDAAIRDIGLGKFNPIFLLPSKGTPPEIWIENENKINAIDNIIQSSGVKITYYSDAVLESDAPYLEFVTDEDMSIDAYINEGEKIYNPNLWSNKFPRLPAEFYANWLSFTYERWKFIKQKFKDIFAYYKSEYLIIKSGLDGEEAVRRVLAMHEGAFHVFYNFRLEFLDKNGILISVETDILVVSPSGIFAVEAKNYGQSGTYRIVITSDGNWFKEYRNRYDEIKREPMPNPFKQNDRHIAYLEKFLNNALGRDMMNWIHVENIVVITNDNVEVQSDFKSTQILARTGNLYSCLTKKRQQLFTKPELDKIKSLLEKNKRPPKKYPMKDYSEDLKVLIDNLIWLDRTQRAALHVVEKIIQNHADLLI